MNKQINLMKKLCNKAFNKDEVPVAALIVHNNKIISKAYNKRNKSNNVLDHAEVIAIQKASKKLKNWRLDECELYVTMFPCNMCRAVIEESRIKRVYYLFENDKCINTKTSYKQLNSEYNEEFKKLLTSFFKNKRYKK